MCFNAANHWDLGWFMSSRRDLGFSGPLEPLKLQLNAFTTNASSQGTVLLKVAGNVYMQYHHGSAHNIDSRKEFADKVVIIQKQADGPTIRLGALSPGEEYRSSSFVIRACAANQSAGLRSMDISIGRTFTNCNSVPLTESVPSPRTKFSSNNWWNMQPSWGTSATSFSNSNPATTTSWWQLAGTSWWQ